MASEQGKNGSHDQPVGVGLQTETFEFIVDTPAGKFFWHLTKHPRKVIAAAILVAVLVGSFLPNLHKDTSAEAFIADDNPAVVYRKQVEETFGLADPVIVAVSSSHEQGIFTAHGLKVVADLTKSIRELEGVDPDRVTSLYTENNIIGDVAGMEVTPFYDEDIGTNEEAQNVFESVSRFPLFLGSLVARDGTATLIIAELMDPSFGDEVFHQIQRLGDDLPDDDIEVYVAGEGAVAEYLGEYIDSDSRRLYPFIGLVIILILFAGYRTKRGIFVPMAIVLGAVIVALGTMAGTNTPMYLITNALPVILIAIGVADGIHIMGAYYEEIALRPFSQRRQPIVRAMVELWRAILFTSITDAVGFAALAIASFMPPMRAFGIYAMVGVVGAGLFSLLVMPAILALMPVKASRSFRQRSAEEKDEHFDAFGIIMGKVGAIVVRFPIVVITLSLIVAALGVAGALRLEVDYARIDYFHEDEPIHKADTLINERFDGSNFIDVVFDAKEPDGLLNAQRLRKMEALQAYAETLPHVGGSTSVVDYIKQMNRALFEDEEGSYVLPDDDGLIAKYFLLFAATGDPEELAKVVDYDYQLANVRISLKSGSYQDIKQVIEPLQDYVAREFSDSDIDVSIAGRANVTYHWIKTLSSSHFTGVAAALLAVFICAALSFRSLYAALLSIVPVTLSILANYAVMGAAGIALGVGTSMFAAIGIGISVNFAIHTLHRTIELVRDYGEDTKRAMTQLFPSTGRALLFNFAAVFFGFAVLMTSEISALQDFGALVAVVTLSSFVTSVTLLPALLVTLNPGFLRPVKREQATPDSIEITTGEW